MAEFMGRALDAVALDMDGTLLDSGKFGVAAIRKAFEKLIAEGVVSGIRRPPTDAAIRAQIGKPPHTFYRDLLPEPDRHRVVDLHHWAGLFEREALADGSGQLFEGARESLELLRAAGLKLLLVSNCSEIYMDAVVEAFDLGRLLDVRAAAGRSERVSKTSELARGLAEVGADWGVMVGDRGFDLEAARANALGFVGCRYGYGPADELEGADALIDDIRDLPALLLPSA